MFNCSNLNWEEIPPNLIIPSSVVYLSLANNRLSKLRNGTFPHLPHLESLDVSHNKLKTLEYSCFDGLDSLLALDLSWNDLQMTTHVYRPGIFRHLKKLKTLHIRGGSIQSNPNYPDAALADLVNLEVLTMDGLQGKIFGKGFKQLTNLTFLDMSTDDNQGYCDLIDIYNTTFSSLSGSKLSVLKLVRCHVYRIYPGSFAMLKHLTYLDLSENQHLAFEGMKNMTFGLDLTSIQTLRLNDINTHGDLITLKQDFFVYFNTTRIEHLTLQSNRLGKINSDVLDCLPTSLKSLSFRDNKLYDVDFLIHLTRFFNLRLFDISYQNTYFNAAMEGDVKYTHKPTDSRNVNARNWIGKQEDNARIPPTELSQTGQVMNVLSSRIIAINHDQRVRTTLEDIKNIRAVPELPYADHVPQFPVNLRVFYGSHMKLSPLVITPASFSPNNSLDVLDLSTNGLEAWYGKWTGLHKLTLLNLSSNGLFRVVPEAFGDMANLKILLLSGNKLGVTMMEDTQCLTFSNQTNLTYLDLSDNGFSDLPDLIFANQYNLMNLHLQQNFFTAINFRLNRMINLRNIILSNNSLTELSKVNREDIDHVTGRSSLTVDLSGNPLLCLCDQLQQLKWMMVTKATFKNIDKYTCKVKNGTMVHMSRLEELVREMEIDCIAGEVTLWCAVGFCVLSLLLSLIALIYYKRSRLPYLFSIGRQNFVPLRANDDDGDEDDNPTKYTVYLSIESSILVNGFVSRFQNYLDNKGISLCIPEVDFRFDGREQVKIVEAMNRSACIIALIDNDYMKSYVRLYEFDVAVTEGIRNHFKNLIVVFLRDLDATHLRMDDIVTAFCMENHCFRLGVSEERLFHELESEILRYKEFTKPNV